jgi:hypothetical protein
MTDFAGLSYLASTGTKLTATTPTVVYAPSGSVGHLSNVHIANVDPVNAVDITLEWYSSATLISYTLLPAVTIHPKSGYAHKFDLVLAPGDALVVTASAANDLHVVVTGSEILR